MSIILTTQPSLNDEKSLNMLGDFGDAIGIPGFPQPDGNRGYKSDMMALASDINNVINKLTGGAQKETFDPSYVGDGRQAIPGGSIDGGITSPLEGANIKQVYSQTPQISVIIKKRAFSGLQHLYDPSLMDSSEQWLLRSIKRVTSAKCEAMALYERLTKIRRLEELGAKPGLILSSLISSLAEESGSTNYFTSAMELERLQAAREVPEFSTYHVDSSFPIIDELGPGNGVFEITTISSLNTSLGIEKEGNCSFEIEDPYQILIVKEQDIEMAIRETALSRFVDVVSSAAGLSLNTAQVSDSQLREARKSRNRSDITFSVGVGSNAGVSAIIDAIGFEITADNLDDIPEQYSLDDTEQTLFKNVLSNLKDYEFAMRKNLLNGFANINAETLKEEIRYTREKMRLYHLGKSIIQPMDAVHILIDGGTRKLGEIGNVENLNDNFDIKSTSDILNPVGNILGLQNEAQVDDDLLKIEWQREGQHMTFKNFKKLRLLQGSGEGGTHVFAGLVDSVTDKFNANTGKFVLNINCLSNMEWLKVSRYNKSPSLRQIQGIVYDPLTPFKFDIDPATGLPIGKPELLNENKKILNGEASAPKIYFVTGEHIGIRAKDEKDLAQDVQQAGGNLITLYEHAPGLVYRWKQGIMTATYNMSTTDPKDGTSINYDQLRREVGQFASNTAFDNMDSANIISLMVTGFPYDPVRFVLSTLQTGSFSKDNSYNDYKQYFHTFLDVQRSYNIVQGGFVPFKTLNVSPKDMANSINTQQKLTNKSTRLEQLRTEQAKLADKLNALKSSDVRIATALSAKIEKLKEEQDSLEKEIQTDQATGEKLQDSTLYVAGNDISVQLIGGANDQNIKLFGDRLRHAALRRREDIVLGRDNNYLIISDEYDKDYDIQAFVLNLRRQIAEMWKSDWETPYIICKRVAEALNFEFFVDTQGHLIFRPPQYNRVPASVLNSLFSMEKTSGINIIPEFIKKLFASREETIINEITAIEYEIKQQGALLGLKNAEEVQKSLGNNFFFITDKQNIKPYINAATKRSQAVDPREQKIFQEGVKKATVSYQLNSSASGGVFNAFAQRRLQDRTLAKNVTNLTSQQSQSFYEEVTEKLARIRGTKYSSLPQYDQVKVGAVHSGQKNESSDVARIVSEIATLESRRSKLLLTLDKVLEQRIEIANTDANGKLGFSEQGLIDLGYEKMQSFYNYLVEDDTKNILGHASGERFIIKDENIIESSFSEKPPAITTVTVTGTEPMVGEGEGTLANIPVYTAFGADFDLWRQYGWRSEQSYFKPFFWNAELQCAPYAVMLLSRQRRNVVTGTVTVMGNEYYQLGDVVYITHRNMLYYVESVQHNISYNGNFSTTLELRYGHPPGDYIPTPLDVIGKGLVSKGKSQAAYRMRRETPPEDSTLSVITFQKDSAELLKGANARRNFGELKNASIAALQEIDNKKPASENPRIYILSFLNKDDKVLQQQRAKAIQDWFISPSAPNEARNGTGLDGIGGDLLVGSNTSNNINDYQIKKDYIRIEYVNQIDDYDNLLPSEKELLRSGLAASQQAFSRDKTLKNVIEIRLRQPPKNGWR